MRLIRATLQSTVRMVGILVPLRTTVDNPQIRTQYLRASGGALFLHDLAGMSTASFGALLDEIRASFNHRTVSGPLAIFVAPPVRTDAAGIELYHERADELLRCTRATEVEWFH